MMSSPVSRLSLRSMHTSLPLSSVMQMLADAHTDVVTVVSKQESVEPEAVPVD